MNYRTFLKFASLAFIAWLGVCSSQSSLATEKQKQPNILFIINDQHTAEAMSCAGNEWVKTPNLDRLAEHGTRFTKAWCSQPLCVPSRASMLTGKYPHEVGAPINVHAKEGYWGDDIKVMGTYLKDAGYETGYVGKWHVPIPETSKKKHGFDYIVNTKRRDWQDASIPADCGTFLKKQNGEKPFFLVASFINPHDICEWARGQKLRMDEISNPPALKDCPPLPENLEIPEGEPSFLRKMHLKSPNQYPTVGWEDNRWREYQWAYYRLIEKVDGYIGLVLESLERHGHLDNTIIVFVSDHGDGNGSHRLNQKQVLYEEATNVPFIISHLTKGQKRVNNNTLINTGLDLIPTFCDYAGVEIPKELDGESAKKYVEEITETGHRYIFAETEFAQGTESFGSKGRAVRNQQYKYVVYNKGENRDQLFDLNNDPGEMKDLSENKEYAKVKEELKKQLVNWQKKTGDRAKLF